MLPTSEDNSAWTVTTYALIKSEYDGAYRDLDLMAFSGLFGVNPNYQAGDNTYYFSSNAGVFIIDGACITASSPHNETNQMSRMLA